MISHTRPPPRLGWRGPSDRDGPPPLRDGRYRYFAHPLPDAIQQARTAFYEHLAPIANAWGERLSGAQPAFPKTDEVLLERCREAGRPQRRARGYHRVGLRHGVRTLTSGERTALGIIFHVAR